MKGIKWIQTQNLMNILLDKVLQVLLSSLQCLPNGNLLTSFQVLQSSQNASRHVNIVIFLCQLSKEFLKEKIEGSARWASGHACQGLSSTPWLRCQSLPTMDDASVCLVWDPGLCNWKRRDKQQNAFIALFLILSAICQLFQIPNSSFPAVIDYTLKP